MGNLPGVSGRANSLQRSTHLKELSVYGPCQFVHRRNHRTRASRLVETRRKPAKTFHHVGVALIRDRAPQNDDSLRFR